MSRKKHIGVIDDGKTKAGAAGDNKPTPIAFTEWDQLPVILETRHMRRLFNLKDNRSLKRLIEAGQLPRPVITEGRIVRWRKEDVRAHLEHRKQMENRPYW